MSQYAQDLKVIYQKGREYNVVVFNIWLNN